MFFRQIYEPSLAQYSYLLGCQKTGEAIVIDPVRDIEQYSHLASSNGLRLTAAADTHIHADYLSGTHPFAQKTDLTVYLSSLGGDDWQYQWASHFSNCHLLEDGDYFTVGNIIFHVLHTPGHTPEHLAYVVTDQGGGASTPIGILSGDLLFVGDVGRPDLLDTAAGAKDTREPAARDLYHSLRLLADLGNELQIWPAHGAGSPCGKALGAIPTSTLGYERHYNSTFKLALAGKEDDFAQTILSGQPDPPLYWAEMKRLNRDGSQLPPTYPIPKVSNEAILHHLQIPDSAVIDTRANRHEFFNQHLRGSLFAPLRPTFPLIVGCFVPLQSSVYLLVEDEHEALQATRELRLIGYDKISGYALRTHVFADEQSRPSLDSFPHLRFADLNQALIEHPDFCLLDARTTAEHEAESIPGALHIPHTRLASRLSELIPNQEHYIHCGSGLRASYTAAFLAHHQFKATAIDDAFESWVESALTT